MLGRLETIELGRQSLVSLLAQGLLDEPAGIAARGAGTYGPYADNLNKVLQAIEGHFTRGYGDSPKPDRDIELLPGAMEKATPVVEAHAESRTRLEKVEEVIEGFETPYGMELLSSVHWVARHSDTPPSDAASAVAAIHSWNDRKRNLFKAPHIEVAWDRLQESGWVN